MSDRASTALRPATCVHPALPLLSPLSSPPQRPVADGNRDTFFAAAGEAKLATHAAEGSRERERRSSADASVRAPSPGNASCCQCGARRTHSLPQRFSSYRGFFLCAIVRVQPSSYTFAALRSSRLFLVCWFSSLFRRLFTPRSFFCSHLLSSSPCPSICATVSDTHKPAQYQQERALFAIVCSRSRFFVWCLSVFVLCRLRCASQLRQSIWPQTAQPRSQAPGERARILRAVRCCVGAGES